MFWILDFDFPKIKGQWGNPMHTLYVTQPCITSAGIYYSVWGNELAEVWAEVCADGYIFIFVDMFWPCLPHLAD